MSVPPFPPGGGWREAPDEGAPPRPFRGWRFAARSRTTAAAETLIRRLRRHLLPKGEARAHWRSSADPAWPLLGAACACPTLLLSSVEDGCPAGRRRIVLALFSRGPSGDAPNAVDRHSRRRTRDLRRRTRRPRRRNRRNRRPRLTFQPKPHRPRPPPSVATARPGRDRRRGRRRRSEEKRILGLLNRGVSIAEIATREGVTLFHIRSPVRTILARRAPQPPVEDLALQVNRLNEALILSYGAMYNDQSRGEPWRDRPGGEDRTRDGPLPWLRGVGRVARRAGGRSLCPRPPRCCWRSPRRPRESYCWPPSALHPLVNAPAGGTRVRGGFGGCGWGGDARRPTQDEGRPRSKRRPASVFKPRTD